MLTGHRGGALRNLARPLRRVGALIYGAVSFGACDQPTPPEPAVADSIEMPVSTMTLTGLSVSQTLSVVATRKGARLTSASVNWSSGNPAVVSVSPSGNGLSALVTSLAKGSATVRAASGTAVATAEVSVVADVLSVSLPQSTLSLKEGRTFKLTASVVAHPNVSTAVAWSSSTPAVATVDTGLVTAVGQSGTTEIHATSVFDTSRRASVVVGVTRASVTGVLVLIPSERLTVGESVLATVSVRDSSFVLQGRTVSQWISSSPVTASVDLTGRVTGLRAGQAWISAIVEGKRDSARIIIDPVPVARVRVSLSRSIVSAGQTSQATATAYDRSDNVLVGRAVERWITSPTGIATVDSGGVVTGVAEGTAWISAAISGVASDSARLQVHPAAVASVKVIVSLADLQRDQARQAIAEARDSDGRLLTGRTVTWATTSSSIASSDSNGLLTALLPGAFRVVATVAGIVDTSGVIVVTQAPVAAVTVGFNPPEIQVGQSRSATVVAQDGRGRHVTGLPVVWRSSNSAVMTVGVGGLVTGVSEGSATIFAEVQGITGSASATVTPAPDVLTIVSVRLSGSQTPAALNSITNVVDVLVRVPFAGARPDSLTVTLDGVNAGKATQLPSECAGHCSVLVTGVNTAAYAIDAPGGRGVPFTPNGSKELVARVHTMGAPDRQTPAVSVVLTNADGFHALFSSSLSSATSAGGLVWHGGNNGSATVQVLPVLFKGNGSIGSVSLRIGSGPSANTSTSPFTASFGATTAPSYSGYQTPVGSVDGVEVTSARYVDGSAAPRTILNASAASVRLDFAPPSGGSLVLTASAASSRWIGAAYDFSTGYVAPNDAGVGSRPASGRVYEYTGCGRVNVVFSPAAHGIAQCGSPATSSAYVARVHDGDLLGNATTLSLSGTFGVDRTAPSVAFSTTIGDSAVILNGSVPPVLFDLTVSDQQSGASSTAVERSVMFWPTSASPRCEIGGGVPGSQPLSSPQCGFSVGNASVGLPAGGVGGWLVYRARAVDQAGNVSVELKRQILVEATPPVVVSASPPPPLDTVGTWGMPVNLSDDIEIREGAVLIRRPALAAILAQPYTGYAIESVSNQPPLPFPTLPFDDTALRNISYFSTPTGLSGWTEPVSGLDSVQAPNQYAGAPTNGFLIRAADHSGRDGMNTFTFPSVPTYQSFHDWNNASPSTRILSFRALPTLASANAALRAELVTAATASTPPLRRIDWFVLRPWATAGAGVQVMCYYGTWYYTATAGVVNGNTRTFTLLVNNILPQPSCTDNTFATIKVGDVIMPIAVRATQEGLAGRPVTVVP